MPGAPWEDDPRDLSLISRNAAGLIASLRAGADGRTLPELSDVLSWHSTLYAGCRVRVLSAQVAPDVDALLLAIHAALQQLDRALPVDRRPAAVDELHAVVALTATVHGEWVRLHPFANGNGRTARTWAAFIALRYSLPVFVVSKPRPNDIAYARAARSSMGRPPDFAGDHSESVAVFGHLLTLALLP